MKLRKYIVFVLAVLVCVSASAYVKAASMPSWNFSSEISRMKDLNILDAASNPYGILTRGDFTRAIVIASGLEDTANLSSGSTMFSDVGKDSPYSGYVNAAVSKGFMKGALDRKYHLEGNINFAQLCTILVKALGYTDNELQGLWPKNYILKARALGLTDGIDLKDTEGVPNWAAAAMMSRLLDTNMKKSSPSEGDKTYGEASGIFTDSYQLAAITSPVYSKPEVASGVDAHTTSIGSIDLVTGSPRVVKNGQLIDISQIEDNDVVYQVSDMWNTKRYILVVDNKIQGQITGMSSTGIQIGGKNYEFGSGMDLNGVINLPESYKVDDYATLLLGYDGKIVGFFDIDHQENGNYALVVNYTYDSYGYTVKLLMVDGNTRTFKAESYPGGYKGQLVTYKFVDKDTVSLTSIGNNNPGQAVIDKTKRLIGDNYVSHDVKIFNLVTSNVGTDEDVKASMIKWSDMPSGTVESGKILYINRFGSFDDINIILTSDIYNNLSRTGIVKAVTPITSNVLQLDAQGKPVVDAQGKPVYVQTVTGHNYTIVVDGTEKPWKDNLVNSAASAGNVVKVLLASNGSIDSIQQIRYVENSASKADGVSVNRIRLNGTSYDLSSNLQVYFVSNSGSYSLKSINDITEGRQYGYISVYLDKPSYNGGKVDTIIIQP